MPFPIGRVGTTRFLEITGLSKTIFFTIYRWDPRWIERFDIRQEPKGRLNMSEDAARSFAAERAGPRALRRSERADNLFRDCPHCAEPIRRKATICRYCRLAVGETS
jgi:hypothetical protein